MNEPTFITQAKAALAEHCAEPIEAVLLVHPTGRRKKVFGRKHLASRLHINNYLVITTGHVRLFGLGGRTGLKVRDELAGWPRSQVRAQVEMAERSSYFASTGSHLDYRTFCVHLTGPDLDLSVDVRADAGLFSDDLDFLEQDAPEVQEAIEGLKEEASATSDAVQAFVRALTPA